MNIGFGNLLWELNSEEDQGTLKSIKSHWGQKRDTWERKDSKKPNSQQRLPSLPIISMPPFFMKIEFLAG